MFQLFTNLLTVSLVASNRMEQTKKVSASSWDPYTGRDRSFVYLVPTYGVLVLPDVTKAISLVPYDQTATDTRKYDSPKRGNWFFGLFLEGSHSLFIRVSSTSEPPQEQNDQAEGRGKSTHH